MRYLKVLALALLFFFSMIFFIQNTETLSTPLQLKLSLLNHSWASQEIPFYLLVLGGFLAGSILSVLYFLVEKVRLASQLRDCRNRMARLEQEVNSLRTTTVETTTYPSTTPAYSTSTTTVTTTEEEERKDG